MALPSVLARLNPRRFPLRKKAPKIGGYTKPRWLASIYKRKYWKHVPVPVFFKEYPELANLSFGATTFRGCLEQVAERHKKKLGSEFTTHQVGEALRCSLSLDERRNRFEHTWPEGTEENFKQMVELIGSDSILRKRFLGQIMRIFQRPNVFTRVDRYENVDAFLKQAKVGSLLDVNCSGIKGAPTTYTTKRALGKKSRIVGIDVMLFKDRKNRTPEQIGIEYHKHVILREPFPNKENPEKFDAVRIGFTHIYLLDAERKALFENSLKSLKEGGYLIVAPTPKGLSYPNSSHADISHADIYQLIHGKLRLVAREEVYLPDGDYRDGPAKHESILN